VGNRIEQPKQSYAKGNFSSYKSYSDEKSKKEFKENKEKKVKKEKNSINNENNRIQKKDQKKKRDFKFGSIKEALDGIHEEPIAKHKEVKANCWRCRRERHYTLECYA
jgi:ATPase subunit of ABC transporter with duplicated ATPase domains